MSDGQQDAILCFDIGGANLKAFHSQGEAICIAFPMWKRPHSLSDELRLMATSLPACGGWGITMTGEMADVFIDRAEGVRRIVAQVMTAASAMRIDDVRFYATTGRFVCHVQAMAEPLLVASANWHALATWVAGWIERPGLLVDIGTTTTDLIPVSPGQVDTFSHSDFDRLRAGELVYLGISRTSLCAIVDALPFDGAMVPIAREQFANTDDCALLLGWVPEDPADTDTCDGRARVIQYATNRIARMIGLGHREVSIDQAKSMAAHVMDRASGIIAQAAARHTKHADSQWIICGHAERLVPVPPGVQAIYLGPRLGPLLARVGPAYALHQLWETRIARGERCP
ncbi:MAG: hydantoinase/oxoprolinase family protein [Planctomycetaceae bacterium]